MRPALLGKLIVRFVDGLHARQHRVFDGVEGLDVGEPLGLARLPHRVDIHGGGLADVLDGLGVGVLGFGHGCVGLCLSAGIYYHCSCICNGFTLVLRIVHCVMHCVLRVHVRVCVCLVASAHDFFQLFAYTGLVLVEPEPIVELHDCVDDCDDGRNHEGELKISHNFLPFG